jgi:DNA-binding transcriptional LysR family regulator
VAVCNRALLDREGPLDSPQTLLGRPLLHDTNRHDWQTYMRRAGLKHAGPAPGPIFQDFNLLRAAALAGQGIALCPRLLIADDLDSGRLVQVSEVVIKEDHAYHVIEPADPGHRHAAAIAAFKSWLLSVPAPGG